MQRVRTESKILKRPCSLIIFAVYCICCMAFTEAYAVTIQAKSCSLADVQYAVNSAANNDVIIIPAGNCNWNATLTITKAITLQGAGADGCPEAGTCITSTFRQNNQKADAPFISYNPASSSVGFLFRVTNMQFNAAYYTWKAGSTTCSYATPILHATGHYNSPFRVDHNRFINVYRVKNDLACMSTMPGGTYNWQKSRPFHIAYLKGVIDSNYIQGSPAFGHTRWGGAWKQATWDGWDNGTDDNLFIEDNILVKNLQPSKFQIGISDQGGSIVYRYNDVDFTGHTPTYFYMADTHGHQAGPTAASFGGEAYGNKIIARSDQGFNVMEARGGRVKVFYNKSTTNAGGVRVRTLWGDDTDVDSSTTFAACPSGTLYAGINVCGIDGRTQHPEKVYIWNNRKYNDALLNVSNTKGAISWNGPKLLRENQEWWKDYGTWGEAVSYQDTKKTGIYSNDIETTYTYTFKSAGAFDGSSGIGCGNVEERPSRCTPGVGFWATNQSCSSVPKGMYGKNPTNPIQGTLYICGSSNNWVASYTPYTYPHPLRSGEADTISAPKGFKLVN